MRKLVDVQIILSNNSKNIVNFYQDNITDYVRRIKNTNLGPQDIFFGYKRYWLPSTSFAAPALTLPHSSFILDPLRKSLLQELKIMYTFPLIMKSVPIEIGGLNLRSLETSAGVQAL